MSEFLQSLLQGLWLSTQWADNQSPSLPLAVFLLLCQAVGVILIAGQIGPQNRRQSFAGGALTVGTCLLALLLTPFDAGWLLLPVPVALSLLCGYSQKPWVRWGTRGLWIGASLAALILGQVALAAIIVCSLTGWLIAFIARQVEPFEAPSLASS